MHCGRLVGKLQPVTVGWFGPQAATHGAVAQAGEVLLRLSSHL